MKNSSFHVKRITTCAVFLSIALVLKMAFSITIPLFGQNGMRIGISGIFSILPSVLFGPVYGAIVSGLSDLLGYLLKPTGALIPLMTINVAFGGFIRGGLWLAADGINAEYYSLVSTEDIDTEQMHTIGRLLILRTIGAKDPAANLITYITCTTYGLIGCGGFGLFLLAADYLISKRLLHDAEKSQVPQLLIAMVVSGIIVTTINTIILREGIYTSWKLIPFSAIWIPRVIEEVLSNTTKAYFVAMLLSILNRQPTMRDLICGREMSDRA